MKTNRKLNWMIITLIVLSLLMGSACADDKLYTSTPFKIPVDQLEEAAPEETPGEPDALPGEELPPEAENLPEETPSDENGQAPSQIEEGQNAEGGEVPAGTAEPELLPEDQRKVSITSSRTEHVTAGEPIYLESHLEGFGNLQVNYRWQVDRNDGQGWQDVGSNRSYHVFIATAESVQYSWRLIVDVVE
ncbi:MAG: hypothetical protein J6U01_07825 [Clostridia bacterium]|nr:hypothetical protein [Clostridia bacterium]